MGEKLNEKGDGGGESSLVDQTGAEGMRVGRWLTDLAESAVEDAADDGHTQSAAHLLHGGQ